MSNFNSLKKVKSLLSDSQKIGTHNERFMSATKTRNSGRIDKYKKGFNEDARFKSFRTEVYFSTYTGAYGSSSVGSFLNISNEENVAKALVKYLRDNEEDVLKGISENLREEAETLIGKAKNEIMEASKFIDTIRELDDSCSEG